MGRETIPKYLLEVTDKTGTWDIVWNVRAHSQQPQTVHGKPTEENIEKYLRKYAKSLELGGVNDHISKNLGYIPYPHKARVVLNVGKREIASWKAPKFMVW